MTHAPRPLLHRALTTPLAVAVLCLGCQGSAGSETLSQCVAPDAARAQATGCLTPQALQPFLDGLPQHLASHPSVDAVEIVLTAGVFDWPAPVAITGAMTQQGRVALAIRGTPSSGNTGSAGATGPTVLRGSRTKPLITGSSSTSFDAYADLSDLPTPKPARRAWVFGVGGAADAEVFSRGQRLPRARWPEQGFAAIQRTQPLAAVVKGAIELVLASGDARPMSALANAREVRVGGYFMHDWAHEAFAVDRLGGSGEIRLMEHAPAYGTQVGARTWLDNVPVPNPTGASWRIDRAEARLYANRVASTSVDVAVVDTAFVLDGARNVALTDLTLSEFLGTAVTGRRIAELWLERLRILNVGGDGINLAGEGLRITGCTVDQAGASGIAVVGGDRRSLTPSRIEVRDNTVSGSGRHIRTYAPAVSIGGVGVQLVGNVLVNGPHAAVIYHGNDHLIQNNRIETFVTEADDAGALYTGQDWSERGTVIDGNFIAHIGRPGLKVGANAIYLDDQASGQTVTNNVLADVDRGIVLGGGSDNTLTGNRIDAIGHALLMDARGWRADDAERRRVNQAFIDRLQAVQGLSAAFLARYPTLAGLAGSEGGTPLRNTFTGNQVASQSPISIAPPARSGITFADNTAFKVDAGTRPMAVRRARQEWAARGNNRR